MAQTVLTHVLEEINFLDADELQSVEDAVRERLRQERQTTQGYSAQEYKALQALVQAGLLTTIKPRRTARLEEFPLVFIEGHPLSETVIEKRR